MIYRNLKKKELELIKEELERYCSKEFVEKFNFNNLIALEGKWVTVCYTNTDVLKNLKLFNEVFFIGNNFGEIKRKFRLSLEGFTLIADNIINNYCIVNEKGETLFLYGRDIFKSSILKIKGYGRIAVFNKNREFLGIGYYSGEIVKNIKDKGWYLREGG
ncbi:hypothetical protein J422_02899 [Methanocaldococcus villosus KIN24-T80]|uniref:Uncharacterized protein n=1 Tax=Methanocaldococcus villosus KIN24-T80 TaxID=1069083 RepID=N6VT64_9EURY|nr:NIP7 N-terminal domain-related protein [Methanocaldococcus villosus]ENN96386.1 hypothetical protein J422_02899 [Methanocaldococcus villosus KIN24-T80]